MLKLFAAVAAVSLGAGAVAQTCPNYPYALSNGTTADANQVMANLSSILTCANTSLAPLASPSFTGNVGIGTTTPAQNLDVESTGIYTVIRIGATSSPVLEFYAGSGATDQKYWDQTQNGSSFFFRAINDSYTSATTWLQVNRSSGYTISSVLFPNGNVGVTGLSGTGNRAVYSDASGNLTNSSSDARMKEKIWPLGHGLQAVEALRPISFNWRADLQPRLGKQREIGFLAQDVRKVVPEVVGENHDGTLSLDYPKLVAVLTAAVQEQQAEIKAQQAQIDELRAALASSKSRR